MTPEHFKAWRDQMGFTQQEAATALGFSRPTIENYERGVRRDDGKPVEIPLTVAYACAALVAGIEAWPPAIGPDEVEVFAFEFFSMTEGQMLLQNHKRTRDDIERIRGAVVEGTGEVVERTKIDANGRFFPELTFDATLGVAEPQRTTNGYGINVVGKHRRPLVTFEFKTVQEATTSKAAMMKALKSAIAATLHPVTTRPFKVI